jgi:hypothetical protein
MAVVYQNQQFRTSYNAEWSTRHKAEADAAMFRHWRIPLSIICLALLVGTVVLWVRSPRWMDACSCKYSSGNGRYIFLSTFHGGVRFSTTEGLDPFSSMEFHSFKIDDDFMRRNVVTAQPNFRVLGFQGYIKPSHFSIVVPFWFLTVMFGAIAGLPWYLRRLHFKFSLRTMLIATTVVALILGAAVLASR